MSFEILRFFSRKACSLSKRICFWSPITGTSERVCVNTSIFVWTQGDGLVLVLLLFVPQHAVHRCKLFTVSEEPNSIRVVLKLFFGPIPSISEPAGQPSMQRYFRHQALAFAPLIVTDTRLLLLLSSILDSLSLFLSNEVVVRLTLWA